MAGTLAITCLTTDDLVAAKAAFSAHEAGLYGSASLIGRVILLPPGRDRDRAASERQRSSVRGSFHRSLVRPQPARDGAPLCGAFTVLYTLAPHLIVRVAFGAKYQGSASLLWMFGVAMTLYSVLNVVLVYRLGHGETRICWLLLAGAAGQAAAFAAFHASPRELLTASIATAAVLAAVAGATSSRAPSFLRGALGTGDLDTR